MCECHKYKIETYMKINVNRLFMYFFSILYTLGNKKRYLESCVTLLLYIAFNRKSNLISALR